MRLPLTPPAASAGDRLAAELVEDLANRLQAGEAVDLEAYVRQHPECADRLRRLLPAVRMLAGLGRSAAGQPAAGPTPGPLPPVLGDFRILREVGRGGMGIVFEAEQVSLRRRVALKVLPFAAVLDPRQLQRFQNEARAAASLHHPNIVPVFAVGHDRGVHFYAMQFIEGQTLAALIHGLRQAGAKTESRTAAPVAPPPTAPYAPSVPGATPPAAIPLAQPAAPAPRPARPPSYFRRVALLGVQAAEALEHAHQTGVVHRDVKPANLLLDQRGNLWVADFGLAQFQADAGLTASGDLVGTLRYMSPEQAQGRRWTDHRVDVYSLGATLYEMLTLEPAFPGSDRQELLRQIAAEEPRPPRRIDRAIPADLETIVGKAMAKSPDDRYGSARALADDLQRFLEDRPIRARPPSLWQKGRRWARRNRPLVWGSALFAALSLLGALLGAMSYAAKQGQIAQDEKTRNEKNERVTKRIDDDLYKARLDRAEGRRLARVAGYREEVWKDLHAAARQDVPARNINDIRKQILACLGDPIGLKPIASPSAARVRRPPLPEDYQKVLDMNRGAGRATAVSPDGRLFAFNPQHGWLALVPKDQRTYHLVRSPLGGIYDLTFTPDRRILVAGCEQGVVLWNVNAHKDPATNYVYHYLMVRSYWSAGNITSVAVHPGGRLLATIRRGGRPVVWNLTSNLPVASMPPQTDGATVEFSTDGKLLLAVVGGRAVRGWPVTETPEKRQLEAPQDAVPSLAFSPDGRLLASGSKDGSARLWDLASGRVLHTWYPAGIRPGQATGFDLTVESVAFSPDGKWLAAGDFQGAVRLWDVASGRSVGGVGASGNAPPGQVWRLQFSASGKYLAAGGSAGVAAWEVRTDGPGVTLRRCREVTPPGAAHGVYDLALRPGGTELAFLSSQGQLYTCDLETPGGPYPLGVKAAVNLRTLQYDDSGEHLSFANAAGKLALWDHRKGAIQDTGVEALHAALGAGGRWAATANARNQVTVYDLKARKPLLTLPEELGDVWSVAWSPDATRLAVGLSDGGIAVWDLERVRARLAEFGIATPSTARGN